MQEETFDKPKLRGFLEKDWPIIFQNVKVRLKETKEAYNQLQYCMIMGWILDGTEVALMAVNGPIADI